MEFFEYKDYDDYVEHQKKWYALKLGKIVYVRQDTIRQIVESKPFSASVLCHGTRSGEEQKTRSRTVSGCGRTARGRATELHCLRRRTQRRSRGQIRRDEMCRCYQHGVGGRALRGRHGSRFARESLPRHTPAKPTVTRRFHQMDGGGY